MPEIRPCPHCQKWISLPVGMPDRATGVCPHCGGRGTWAEFAACWPPALVIETVPDPGTESLFGGAVTDDSRAAREPAITADPWAHLRESPTANDPAAPLIQNETGAEVFSARKRRNAPGGGIVELAKIVFGGIVGLAIGYWLLLWITGNDFLEASRFIPGWALPVSAERTP